VKLIKRNIFSGIYSYVLVFYINYILQPDIIVYYSDKFEYTFIESIVRKCKQERVNILVLKKWLKIAENNDSFCDFRINEKYLERLESQVFLSPQKRSVTGSKWLIHVPHSLVSLHAIYKINTFDKFNCLFSCGPHHDDEFNELSKYNGLDDRLTFKIGYTRLEFLHNEFKNYDLNKSKKNKGNKTILLAPTFTNNQFFVKNGGEIISTLINSGYKVIYRPHRYKMSSEFEKYIQILSEKFTDKNEFELELNPAKANSLFIADILITDYSGIAFEFSFLRERPVLFLDLEKKIGNPEWERFKSKPVEINLRKELGIVSEPNIDNVVNNIDKLFNEHDQFVENIKELKDNYLYNYPYCSDKAFKTLIELLKN